MMWWLLWPEVARAGELFDEQGGSKPLTSFYAGLSDVMSEFVFPVVQRYHLEVLFMLVVAGSLLVLLVKWVKD